jgi:hypothetical protein
MAPWAETCNGIVWLISSIMHSEIWVNWYSVVSDRKIKLIYRTSSSFSKPKISRKNNAADMPQPIGLQSAMMVIRKCGRRNTSWNVWVCIMQLWSLEIPSSWRSGLKTATDRTRGTTGRIWWICSELLLSQKYFHTGEVACRQRQIVLQGSSYDTNKRETGRSTLVERVWNVGR